VNHGQAEQLISEASDDALYEILNLRTITAQQIIDKEKKHIQGDLYYDYLENWKEIIELMAYEDDARYDQYLTSFNTRIERINAEADKTSPAYHILLGEIYAHAGMANVMFGDYFAGFRKILKANRNVKKNVDAHPDYWLNNKLSGMLNVSLDKIPSIMKWFTSLFGLAGNSEDGYKKLGKYLEDVQEYPGLKSEALLYYTFALKLSKKDDVAYELLINENEIDQSPSLLLFVWANLLYLTERNEEALTALSSFPNDQLEIPFHYMTYMTGKAKQNRLDEDADVYLLNFLEKSNGKNFKREICMRLAFHYYVYGDQKKYIYYKNLVPNHTKPNTDRDREADVESLRPYDPHPELLKARFLTSGSYYSRANEIISNIDPKDLDRSAFQAEYYLQKGKIRLGMRYYDEVIKNCNKAIVIGKELNEPYAAEAALVAGYAFHLQDDLEKSESYLKLALKIKGKNDVYIENIHKRAKNRLKIIGSVNHASEIVSQMQG
ncbi:MAG: hypothetical protein KAR17_08965, partial [Cyclobacteriaceae bacterium]|nr:hypothetical protein [Cyclobacteriaceae bacterium]